MTNRMTSVGREGLAPTEPTDPSDESGGPNGSRRDQQDSSNECPPVENRRGHNPRTDYINVATTRPPTIKGPIRIRYGPSTHLSTVPLGEQASS